MAVEFRGASSAIGSSGEFTIQRPPGAVAGDVMVVAVTAATGTTITSPAGWTLVAEPTAGARVKCSVFRKVAANSEPPSYTFTGGAAAAAAYSGAKEAQVALATGSNGNASTAHTRPSITTPEAGMLVYIVGARDNDGGTINPVSGHMLRVNEQNTVSSTVKYLAHLSDLVVPAGTLSAQSGSMTQMDEHAVVAVVLAERLVEDWMGVMLG